MSHMWQKCGDCHNCHNYPRCKNVEKKFKNPHKIDFFHIFHIFILKMWSEKALVYKAKVPFSTFPRFFRNFLENFFLKRYFSSKMWKKGKIELLSLVYNKSSFHVFKTKNVENVESRNYQRLFKIENVEENV